MNDDRNVDLAVIGSGGAAMAAAIAARQAGADVVLVEQGTLGGTCVNVGCVPSKTLLAAAGARHSAGTHPFAGVSTSADGVDFAALVAQKDELVGGCGRPSTPTSPTRTAFRCSRAKLASGIRRRWRSTAGRCEPGLT